MRHPILANFQKLLNKNENTLVNSKLYAPSSGPFMTSFCQKLLSLSKETNINPNVRDMSPTLI